MIWHSYYIWQGLEFDDVILYNFFDDQIAVDDEQWETIMKKIEVKNIKNKQEEKKTEEVDEEKGI